MLHLLLKPTVNSEWQTNCSFWFTLDVKDWRGTEHCLPHYRGQPWPPTPAAGWFGSSRQRHSPSWETPSLLSGPFCSGEHPEGAQSIRRQVKSLQESDLRGHLLLRSMYRHLQCQNRHILGTIKLKLLNFIPIRDKTDWRAYCFSGH